MHKASVTGCSHHEIITLCLTSALHCDSKAWTWLAETQCSSNPKTWVPLHLHYCPQSSSLGFVVLEELVQRLLCLSLHWSLWGWAVMYCSLTVLAEQVRHFAHQFSRLWHDLNLQQGWLAVDFQMAPDQISCCQISVHEAIGQVHEVSANVFVYFCIFFSIFSTLDSACNRAIQACTCGAPTPNTFSLYCLICFITVWTHCC